MLYSSRIYCISNSVFLRWQKKYHFIYLLLVFRQNSSIIISESSVISLNYLAIIRGEVTLSVMFLILIQ